MSRALEVVTLTTDQVRSLIHEAVAMALDDQRRRQEQDASGLSASAAAKLARRRRSDVVAAMTSGALKATRSATGRWSTSAGAVRGWVEAGAPSAVR